MPQVGERRSGATETVEWDGSRWAPVSAAPSTVDNPRSFGLLDMIPGLKDALNIPENLYKGAKAAPDVLSGLVHEPAATLKGFASGASEAATPGRLGLLALLTPGLGATLPAALAAAGGQATADAIRVATDAPNAPTSFGRGVGDVAEAAAVPAVAAGLGKIPALARKIPGAIGTVTSKIGPSTIGGTLGAVDGYRRGGITGAIEGGVAGATTGRLLRALEGMTPAAEAEAAVAPADPSAPHMDFSRPVPASSLTQEQIGQRYTAARAAGGAPKPAVEPTYQARPTPGSVPQAKLDSALGGLTGDTATAAADNIANGSSFSNGHIIPEARPTELTDLAEEGGARQDRPYDIDYGGVMPDFTFEAGDANRPGLSVGSAGPKTTLDRLENAVAPLTNDAATAAPSDGMARTFSQFSDDVDHIANQEPGPLEDLFGRKSGFLSRSTPTKADQAGLAELRARRLASTLQSLQPQ